MLARLQHQHETISELVDGFTEQQLKERVNPEKWSSFENITHLVAYQPAFIQRIGLMLQGTQPVFKRYVADNDPLFHEYLKKSLPELLSITAKDRSEIISLLTSLKEDQLKLIALHPKFGTVTVIQWTEMFLLHEAHHLWVVLQLISTFRVAPQ